MSEKDAILFFQKSFEDNDFQNDMKALKNKNFESIQLFAQQHHFNFSKEEFLIAFKKNYKMRWLMHMGKKKI